MSKATLTTNIDTKIRNKTVSQKRLADQLDEIVTEMALEGEGGGISDGDKGDITVSAVGSVWTIDNNTVTNAKSAQMATKTYKGRTSGTTGNPEDVSVATLKTDLALVKGDVGLGNVVNADTTTTANITDSANKRFVSDAQQTVIGNTSGTNTGDNATNSQYSGLAASKEDTANKQTNLTASATKFPTVDAVNTGLATKQKTITSGTAAPSGGLDGDIYLQYI